MQASYDRTARLLHWMIAALLLAQLIFGWWLGDVPRGTPARGYWVNWHKSTGLLLGLLIIVRLGWRLRHRAPAWPEGMPRWQQKLAAGSHHLIYLLMLLVPLAGYLASNFSKHGVKFFNTWVMSPWGMDDKVIYGVLNQIHKTGAALLLALIVLHVLAALHHLARRDGVFARMWPSRSP